jgi:hypothetical protein
MDAYANGCRATLISTRPSSEKMFKSASLNLVALRSGIQAYSPLIASAPYAIGALTLLVRVETSSLFAKCYEPYRTWLL